MYSVIIIDDSSTMRNMLKRMINSVDGFEVIATAMDAYDARNKIKKYEPDFITLDIEMPKMDGLTFLKNLMRLHPMPTIVVSSLTSKKRDLIDAGAIDFIYKDKLDSNFFERLKNSLMTSTHLFDKYKKKKPTPKETVQRRSVNSASLLDGVEKKYHPDELLRSMPNRGNAPSVIAIGSSTGGVESLITVFESLGKGLCPIIISQHIPETFSASFANRLDRASDIKVYEAKDGQKLEKSCAYLAPGNRHLTLRREGADYYIELVDGIKISRHKPSVDIMFRSLNNVVGKSALGIIMTGMGDDGTIGLKELHDNGAFTIGQSERTCVVYGMPAKAYEAGAVEKVVDLQDIAEEIIKFSKMNC
jgi:two-component system chemotaxis response regulator CheB